MKQKAFFGDTLVFVYSPSASTVTCYHPHSGVFEYSVKAFTASSAKRILIDHLFVHNLDLIHVRTITEEA